MTMNVAKKATKPISSLFSVLGTFNGGVSNIVSTVGKVVEGFGLWRIKAGTLSEVLEAEFPTFASKISPITGVVGKIVEGFSLWQGGAGTLMEVLTLEDVYKRQTQQSRKAVILISPTYGRNRRRIRQST